MATGRHHRALQMRLSGATYAAIAKELGFASASGAYHAVARALKDTEAHRETGEAASTELARLDAMLAGLWPKASRGEVSAVDRVLAIEKRRADILAAGPPAETAPAPANGLTDFEKRLREREKRAADRTRGASEG